MSEAAVQTISAVGAGVGAVVLAMIGVEPSTLLWALIGCGLGVPFAPAAGRMRATITFILAAMASALLGTLLATEYLVAPSPARLALASKGAALLLAIAFHPLISAIVATIPSVWGGIMRRLGLTAEAGK